MNTKGYLFAELTVNDREVFFNEYMPKVRPILEQFKAKFLVATEALEVVEGGRGCRELSC